MGCRCCKMIQSYLFDPVQVPSPGYVNEVSSCKLEEEDTVKLRGKQDSEVLVHKGDLQSEGVRRTASRRRAGPPEPCWPPPGTRPPAAAGGGLCAEKAGGAVNGIGPAVALQPTGDPAPHHGGSESWASTTNSVHPAQPVLEGGDARDPDGALLASGETPVPGNGDSRAPSEAERPAVEEPDGAPQIPAPDYPQRWGAAGDHVGKDDPFKSPPEETQGPSAPFSLTRSWDSPNEALAADVLSVYFKDEDPARALPVADWRNGWGDAGRAQDEDAAVAEALAALEAATAGEEVD